MTPRALGLLRPFYLVCLLTLVCLAPTRAAPRESIDVVVLLDNSGSMARQGTLPGNDEGFMRVTAVQYLLEKMAPGDRIALVTFDSVVHLDPAASHLRDVAAPGMPAAFLQGMHDIAATPNDSTNMAAGFHAAETILRAGGGTHRRQFLVFLTDGTPNPARGENTPDGLARLAAGLGREGVVIHTIGLGDLSPDPKEAAAARALLEEIARQGHGDMHMAGQAEDLPPLFGSIFAQLAGHEISQTVAAGGRVSFTLAPGTHNLRVLATSEGAPPEMTLTDPAGKAYPSRLLTPLLPGRQTARIAVDAINGPALGLWTAVATRGTLEVAWEPDFEAVLLQPGTDAPVPSHAPVPLVVDLRQRGTDTAAAVVRGRVSLSYELSPGAPPHALNLTEDPDRPNRFTGTLPDSGSVGVHHLTIQCFRSGKGGEEEGGPAFAVIRAERLPELILLAPTAGAAYSLPGPVPVRAQLALDGQAVTPASVRVRARLEGAPGAPDIPLSSGDGVYAGRVPVGGPPGQEELAVTLSGSFDGTNLAPQTVTRPVTVTPTPIVAIRWPTAPTFSGDPGGEVHLDPDISSSASAPQFLTLSSDGADPATVVPPELTVAAGQPAERVPVRLRLAGLRPGTYAVTITAHVTGNGVLLTGGTWRGNVHVRGWLERNRWWFFPTLGLLAFLALLTAVAVALWLRERARRRQMMLNLLNGAAVYVPHTTHAYRPPTQEVLMCTSYTFGGKGADVPIPDPTRPGDLLFGEPRLRVGVVWQSGRGCLAVTQEGTQTQWYDLDGHLLFPPLRPTEGGVTFRVEPEHVLVRVNSEWTP